MYYPSTHPSIHPLYSITYHRPISHQPINPLSHRSSATSLQTGHESLSKFPGRKGPRPHLSRTVQPGCKRDSAAHNHLLLSETPAHRSFPVTPCCSTSESRLLPSPSPFTPLGYTGVPSGLSLGQTPQFPFTPSTEPMPSSKRRQLTASEGHLSKIASCSIYNIDVRPGPSVPKTTSSICTSST